MLTFASNPSGPTGQLPYEAEQFSHPQKGNSWKQLTGRRALAGPPLTNEQKETRNEHQKR